MTGERCHVLFSDGRLEKRFVYPSTHGQRPFKSGHYVLDGTPAIPVKVRRLTVANRATEWQEVRTGLWEVVS